jgi:DNA replication regulator DPB11
MPQTGIPSTDDLAFECEVVTDMWLERCLAAKALVSPESHVANTPVPRFPIPGKPLIRLTISLHDLITSGFNGMKICSTGVSRIDLLHLVKLVSLLGKFELHSSTS